MRKPSTTRPTEIPVGAFPAPMRQMWLNCLCNRVGGGWHAGGWVWLVNLVVNEPDPMACGSAHLEVRPERSPQIANHS